MTDADGVATLECPEKALLVISALGYKTTLVPVNNNIALLVVLEADIEVDDGEIQFASDLILPKEETIFTNQIFRS